MPTQPFSPQVKTHMIDHFLSLPELVKIPDHRTAFHKAERMYRTWTKDQDEKEHRQWLDGTMYGRCPCGYTYENDQDYATGHGASCPFAPDDPARAANATSSVLTLTH